jgi:hypothetical protein
VQATSSHEVSNLAGREGTSARLGYPERLFDCGVTAVWADRYLEAVQASGWHNGSPRSSGAGYGIRISKVDRDRYFVPGWDTIELEFPDGQRVEVELTRSFWKPETQSAELRDAAIGRWLIAQGAAPWPKRSPPQLVLAPLGPKRFSVTPSG